MPEFQFHAKDLPENGDIVIVVTSSKLTGKSAKIDKIATVDITTKIYFIFPVTKVVVTGN